MGYVLMPGMGGGADTSIVTATAADVIKGKVIVGPDGEPITGTLELTGNASDGNVLKNKTYYNTDAKTKRTGTMPDHTGVPQHIDARRLANNRFEVAVAAGYHGYSWAGNSYEYMEFSEVAATLGLTAAKLAKGQTVCGIAGTYTSDANAVASNIENAKTAYVNGSKIIGSMATMAGGTYTPGSSDQTISCSGKKMTSNIIIKAVPDGYVNTGTWTVFRNGVYSANFGVTPRLYWIDKVYGGFAFRSSMYAPYLKSFTGLDVDTNQQCTYTGITQDQYIVERGTTDSGENENYIGYPFLNRAIDFTNFSKLYIKCYFKERNTRCTAGVAPIDRTSVDNPYFAFVSTKNNCFVGSTFDISKLKGQYFVRLIPAYQANRGIVEIKFIP